MKSITRKTLLYKSGVEYADYGLNHVEGCSHGCNYPCYAYMMKKRCGVVKTYPEWIEPKIVSNALELLDKELPRLKDKINCVFLCFSTDPFMYKQPEVVDLTLNILEKLNQYGIRSTLISKGEYSDELAERERYGENNEYGSTIVSLSEEYRKKFEPGAAPIKNRIMSLKKLHDAGLKTWVSMEPYPTPNIVEQNIEEILESISFVDKIVFGKWNYNKVISEQLGSKEFYNEMAIRVIKFCEQNKIDLHIKDGTISKDKMPAGQADSTLNRYIEGNLSSSTSSKIFNIS